MILPFGALLPDQGGQTPLGCHLLRRFCPWLQALCTDNSGVCVAHQYVWPKKFERVFTSFFAPNELKSLPLGALWLGNHTCDLRVICL